MTESDQYAQAQRRATWVLECQIDGATTRIQVAPELLADAADTVMAVMLQRTMNMNVIRTFKHDAPDIIDPDGPGVTPVGENGGESTRRRDNP